MILFSIGEDDYNILVEDATWFFFHEPLILTCFFLFIRYSNTGRDKFNTFDYLLFLPYLLYILIETLSNSSSFVGNRILEIGDEFIELSFLGMHNGIHASLEEVMEFYEDIAEGDDEQRNINVTENELDEEMQDLDLDNDQIDIIIAFLHTLNDDSFDQTIPDSVPSGLAVGGNID